ncbi:DNA mismatch repair protein MutS [Gluconobacter thailandicus]|uniref:DNA mismatch repair protein MutS n=1 Tax=Gluconobacter thailandicus TaxID=257438 RepID=A0AAP9JHT6_GLUTH|nr:DNA mismatch repair protein MutS [Gluconobacter thailandicus]QEH96573.1 DNA mismatch repair protein MutS [Gluconobacter thailandicus]
MPLPSAANATPSMAQWFDLKHQEPDALLFFRMGDFYELFFGDAQAAAMALDIALTARGNHNGEPIPMCGVPVAAAPAYLSRLIRRGFRVAVAEQTQTPQKGQKGPLPRAIVRVVTPGTLTEDELLEAGRANLLLAIARSGTRRSNMIGAAWIDISTGAFETTSVPEAALPELMARLDAAEVLSDPELIPADHASRLAPVAVPPTIDSARTLIARAYGVAQLDALGDFPDEQAIACAMALNYVQRSQAGTLPRLSRPIPQGVSGVLGIDPATRASLDILRTRDGETKYSLFGVVSRTATAAGSRLLSQWLSSPLTNAQQITDRQNAWLWLQAVPGLVGSLGDILKRTPDPARALGRLSAGRGQPRDLAAIRDTLVAADDLTGLLQPVCDEQTPTLIRTLTAGLYGRADTLLDRLKAAVAEDLPARIEDGGFIATGFDSELDRYRTLRDESRRIVAALQGRLSEEYGIGNLKIRHHAQLGYVIEVPSAAGAKLKDRPELSFRQGTASLARFSTEELAALDRAILEAADKASALERRLFAELCTHILQTPALDEVAEFLALADVLRSCALLSEGGSWCRPDVTDGTDFELIACRHPVVEAALAESGSADARFIPNDCKLPPEHRAMLLTGPNMAGKSTFLRQTALAVVMAQAGLPVPAKSAKIGVVDRLFSRVGGADDLARGRSTFMVEMTETAAILNQAGPKSLVVVDEIGRGTATLDGLSIAWATLEALHTQLGSRTIFATHFHELGALTEFLPRLAPYTMAVKEWRGEVIFQHEVRPGSARKSWGLHVAKLAGIPQSVVNRASRLLATFEREQAEARSSLPLFEAVAETPDPAIETPAPQSAALDALTTLNPDDLSPREALAALYDLKRLATGDRT